MSPTSIGFVFLLGILHVCSGKRLGLTTYRLSAGWTSFGRKFFPMFEENLCSHVQFFFLLNTCIYRADFTAIIHTLPKAPVSC